MPERIFPGQNRKLNNNFSGLKINQRRWRVFNRGMKRCINATFMDRIYAIKGPDELDRLFAALFIYHIYNSLNEILNLKNLEEQVAIKCYIICIILHHFNTLSIFETFIATLFGFEAGSI